MDEMVVADGAIPDVPSADAFLRPESMVTPGALGALTMLITNALGTNFAFINHATLALLLSFIFGITAIIKAASLPSRVVYYVINSLIIFSVATGSNSIGNGVARAPGAGQFALNPVSVKTAYARPPAIIVGGPGRDVVPAQFFQPWFKADRELTIAPADIQSGWSVVVGSAKTLQEGRQLEEKIEKKFPGGYTVTVRKSSNSDYWAVVVGDGNLSLIDAAQLQKRAIADGLAPDAYLKRSSELQ